MSRKMKKGRAEMARTRNASRAAVWKSTHITPICGESTQDAVISNTPEGVSLTSPRAMAARVVGTSRTAVVRMKRRIRKMLKVPLPGLLRELARPGFDCSDICRADALSTARDLQCVLLCEKCP
jgi:hypothetical protein